MVSQSINGTELSTAGADENKGDSLVSPNKSSINSLQLFCDSTLPVINISVK